ncbi:hypothetical protein QFC21_006968 [Naganishia friedmannii]|uniref:Uncharacterized protein n=1 Tax=Naganishia friedmannii TaxID=89922 RepID=A0ACC2V0G2_9TREE|nr:hypothetical protein QFC21_006968 [Naganishia friedmannii]
MFGSYVGEHSKSLIDVKIGGGPPAPPSTNTIIEGDTIGMQQDGDNNSNGAMHEQEDESERPRFTPMFDSEAPAMSVEERERTSESGTTAHVAAAPLPPIPSVLQPASVSAATSKFQTAELPPHSGPTKSFSGLANGIIQPGPSLSELPGPSSFTSTVPLPYPPFTAPLPSNQQHMATAVPPTPASHSLTPVLPLRNRSSCTNCRKRKQRCDHGSPGEACRGCLKGGKVCVYPGGIVLTPSASAAGTPLGGTVGTSAVSGNGGKETPTTTHGSKRSQRKKNAAGAEGRRFDSKRFQPSSTRGNREFTDSEAEDSGRAESHESQSSSGGAEENDNQSKRQPRQLATISRSSGRTNGQEQGDEVDELDDEEDDEEEEEEKDDEQDAAGSNDSGNENQRPGSLDIDNAQRRSASRPQQHFRVTGQSSSNNNGNGSGIKAGKENNTGKDTGSSTRGRHIPQPYVGYVSLRPGEPSQDRECAISLTSRTTRPDQSATIDSKDDNEENEEDDSAAESQDGGRSTKNSSRHRQRPHSRQERQTHSSSSLDDPLTNTANDPRESQQHGHILPGHGGSAKYTSSTIVTSLPGGINTGHGLASGSDGAGLVHERFMGGLGPKAVSAAGAATVGVTRGSESPSAEHRAGKRKSTVAVGSSAGIEGDVEGEILALVEEDQRPSKHKKGRITSPRRTAGGSLEPHPFQSDEREHYHNIPVGGRGDSVFQSAGPSAMYSADFGRPPPPPSVPVGGFSVSGRSGSGYGMDMPGSFVGHNGDLPPGAGHFPHPSYQQEPSGLGMPQMQYSAPAQVRPSSVSFAAAGPSGMIPNYPGSRGCLPSHPQQMGVGTMGMPGMRYDQHSHHGAGEGGRSIDFSARATSHDSIPAFLQSPASPYATSLAALINVLPPPGTQHMLYQTFFHDAFLPEGVTLLQAPFLDDIRYLLHRRSTQQQGPGQPHMSVEAFKAGDATTLALAFAILAAALRILPEESSQLLLSSVDPHAYPRGLDRVISGRPGAFPQFNMDDKTPLHRRYMDHALLASLVADAEDPASPMQVCLKLVCYRYARMCASQMGINVSTGQIGKPKPKENLTGAGMYLVQGIKVAQAIGLHREREGTPTVECELRRRMFYALYTADRLHAFETLTPYMINDQHTSTHLPAAASDSELYQLSTGQLLKLPHHDYKRNPVPIVHLVVMTHIAKSMSPLVDTLAVYTAADISSGAVDRYDAAFQACEDDLPSYYQLLPATNTNHDLQDPYIHFHRINIQSFLYGLRFSLYRPKLNVYLSIKTPHSVRSTLSKLCLRALRIQKSARIQESKFAFRLFSVEKVFEAAFCLAFIVRVELAYAAADKAQPNGAAAYPVASEDSMEDMQQALHAAIELLEGVTSWPDAGALAVKACKILRKIAKMLSASWNLEGKRTESSSGESIKSNRHVVRVTSWLKSWRGMDVDTLVAEADYDDWNKVLRSMQA